jgi:hypothetical protein
VVWCGVLWCGVVRRGLMHGLLCDIMMTACACVLLQRQLHHHCERWTAGYRWRQSRERVR